MKVTILQDCIAGKKPRAMGADVELEGDEAKLMLGMGRAAKLDSDEAKAAKKAAAAAAKAASDKSDTKDGDK